MGVIANGVQVNTSIGEAKVPSHFELIELAFQAAEDSKVQDALYLAAQVRGSLPDDVDMATWAFVLQTAAA